MSLGAPRGGEVPQTSYEIGLRYSRPPPFWVEMVGKVGVGGLSLHHWLYAPSLAVTSSVMTRFGTIHWVIKWSQHMINASAEYITLFDINVFQISTDVNFWIRPLLEINVWLFGHGPTDIDLFTEWWRKVRGWLTLRLNRLRLNFEWRGDTRCRIWAAQTFECRTAGSDPPPRGGQ